MPKELQGQKPTADAIQANALVAKISTGEIDEDLKEPLGKVRYGKAEPRRPTRNCLTTGARRRP